MKVLGVDPGTHRVGWGILTGTPAKQTLLACGCLESPSRTKSAQYLVKIKKDLDAVIEKYSPDLLGLETLLFQKNVKTAISVAEARGVVLLTASEHQLPVVELAPNTVKLVVAGSGSAGKQEVLRMVGLLLKLDTEKLLDDTADALAVAISAIVTHRQL